MASATSPPAGLRDDERYARAEAHVATLQAEERALRQRASELRQALEAETRKCEGLGGHLGELASQVYAKIRGADEAKSFGSPARRDAMAAELGKVQQEAEITRLAVAEQGQIVNRLRSEASAEVCLGLAAEWREHMEGIAGGAVVLLEAVHAERRFIAELESREIIIAHPIENYGSPGAAVRHGLKFWLAEHPDACPKLPGWLKTEIENL